MNKALAAGAGKEAQRMAAKQQMATAAHQILQDPNKHQHQLQLLLKLLDSDDARVNADALRWCFQTLLLRVYGSHRCGPNCLASLFAGVPACHALTADSVQGPVACIPYSPSSDKRRASVEGDQAHTARPCCVVRCARWLGALAP